ncbi:hypothetical protein COW36_23460 [bacterium (Candidatus Blackallbacteria) CG17_big_fil_post_rev_8_21_14_2_50_48_46]|uniref:Uncharacterized protein n=1 Tax=bacterium (Candidatus Blackallbacteria) CG17_big_fil_post_rev_8_21_14_2_50_48_46 TaxID=2014261 RepID=A0A2M7FYA0_9BACT|nr:MAG: hypothetical protein COW64_17670 [bacterium (Candidatus Blackallbacteria) CG18_big_fil_WC_8_21_14_2_50_49_26]PIW14000.1 MAG: hypothetical protein COW36_23460 [bacterium (Candidatus Blackallbacteria) CG17_big_fil_post_rev_8_21_14_2_50_48_46]PIW46851.1 MAG: hypothetical protein COW20_14635 [bacterium (Candidatus Blackallbacteria) CG13_big_fil_rev_8_21_14_2_50_49_14]
MLRFFTLLLTCVLGWQCFSLPLYALEFHAPQRYVLEPQDRLALLPLSETPALEAPFCGEACWSASFFLPGAGQLFLGEPLRGWGFMAGTLIAPWVLATLSMASLQALNLPGWNGSDLQQATPFFILAALLGSLTLYIWNIFDAYGLQLEKDLNRSEKSAPLPEISERQPKGSAWQLQVGLFQF